MRRGIFILIVLFAATANARQPPPPPVPPTLAAPVPDLTIVDRHDEVTRTWVTLYSDINHRASPEPGLGYGPGAQYKLDNDRKLFFLPGLMVHIPLP